MKFESRQIHLGTRFAVFRVQRDGQRVIIKTLRPDRIDAQSEARLHQEHALLSGLAVPGVVRPIALEEWDGSAALVLTDVGPLNLEEWLSGTRLDLSAFLGLAVQMAAIVAGVHSQNVIHRDLCPANFVLGESGRLTLVDFELGTMVTGLAEAPGRLEGTLPYLAPEQTGRMRRLVDHRADLYALGATFYQMLVGSPPFAFPDPLEVIHAHLAQMPMAPAVVRPELPRLVSDLVLKLLAKMPEWRYQTAESLQADLEEARQQWLASGGVAPFELARLDRRELQLSSKLYGREREQAELATAFTQTVAGANELVVIRGLAGIGKTAIVEQMRPEFERQGWFLAGKCDQLAGNVPFAAFAEAFRALTRELLNAPQAEANAWRARIQHAVSPHGRVLTEIVPNLERVLGEQPALPSLGPVETANRAELTLVSFVQALARPDHPLVLFLDDLQWVDPASLKLLLRLATDADSHHLLVLLAFRSEEVGSEHPAARALDDMRRAGAHLVEIDVGPLDVGAVTTLLGETLGAASEQCAALADTVVHKTAGNPLFALRFVRSLHGSGQLTFDIGVGAWRWDLARIAGLPTCEGVADLLVASIKRLPTPVQDALMVAACIGNRFELGLLSAILGQSVNQVARTLWTAIREVLVVPVLQSVEVRERSAEQTSTELSACYRFVHDRVQQAAYTLLSGERRTALHLAIGRELYARTPERERSEHLFAIVDQLNRGEELLRDEAERLLLLDLNEQAASRAKAASAYSAAFAYLRRAIALLPDGAWSGRHDLAMRLHRDAAELAFVAAALEEAEALSEAALTHAASRLEKANLHALRVTGYTLRFEATQAIRAGNEGLRLFGLNLLEQEPGCVIAAAMAALEERLAGRTIGELVDVPMAGDLEQVALQSLLSELLPILYQCDSKRYEVLTLWATRACLENGHTLRSPHLYVGYGLLLATRGEYKRAHAFGRLAIELARKLGAMEGRVLFMFTFFLNHWCAPFRSSLPLSRLGLAKASEAGDLLFASYCQSTSVTALWELGKELGRMLPDVEEELALSRRFGSTVSINILVSHRQAIRCLRGMTSGRGRFDDAEFDEGAFLAGIQQHQTTLGLHASVRFWVLYLLGDLYGALAMLEVAQKHLSFFAASVAHAGYVFHAALTLVALAERSTGEEREAFVAQVAPLEATLRRWAESCPENFRHKHALVLAELARLDGADTGDVYLRAIEGAAQEGFLQDEAVAQELCARYCLARGQRHLAAQFFGGALDAYSRWGATAKVDLLRDELTHLDLPVSRRWTTPATPSGEAAGFDLLTLFKAAETLSSEVVLDRLLDKMMRICVETAGAERGSLVVERDGKVCLEARFDAQRGRTERGDAGADDHRPLVEARAAGREPYSEAIARHTLHTGQDVVLGNAAEKGDFTRDRYVLARASKSILSMAVRHRDRIIAVLFLENDLSTDAFTEERLEMLRLLLAQAAISLENARLYDSLRANEALLRDFFEGLPIGVFVVDGQGRAAFANRRAIELAGEAFDPELRVEGAASSYQICVAGRDELYPTDRFPLARALAGETMMADDLEIRRPDRTVPIAVWGTPIRGDDGAVRYAIVAFQDISEQRALEAQLRQAQRLESIGRLAGGVAHDFNNLLTPMLVYSELAVRALPADSPLRRQIHQIHEAAEHAAALTRQLLAFGRQQALEPRELDLNQELRSFERMFRRLVREDIDLQLRLDPELGKIKADPSQMQSVFTNLGMNAADAMPHGGRITFETANVSDGPSVALRVRDTGHGMDKETLDKIFDPFFTTKEPGKGTGLGLPTVYGIVTQHGGRITARSEAGKGATFEVLLPRVCEEGASAGRASPSIVSEGPMGRGETLLVVEDDDAVRAVIEDVLVRDGYHVVATASPAEALRIARGFGTGLDLLITDMVMPIMTGRELAAELKRGRPALAALFISGYSKDVTAVSGERAPDIELLEKPLYVDSLRIKVRDVLGRRPNARHPI